MTKVIFLDFQLWEIIIYAAVYTAILIAFLCSRRTNKRNREIMKEMDEYIAQRWREGE